MFELARTQDDEAGDGTTTVVILCGEVLKNMKCLLNDFHPIHINKILTEKMNFCLDYLMNNLSSDIKEDERQSLISNSVNTKLCRMLNVPVDYFAYKASNMVFDKESKICDIKNNVRVEKILGDIKECKIYNGILVEKNIIHPQMRRRIENPRIAIIEIGMEYKKGESQLNYEFSNENDFTNALKIEDEYIKNECQKIIDLKIDILCVEKGISDLALSILQSNKITALRRFKRSETERLRKVTGARIVNKASDLEEKDVGVNCSLFEYQKIAEDYFCLFEAKNVSKACTVLLRGPSKDVMNELERNFHDAIKVAKNLLLSPKVCPGGGATEMGLALGLINNYKEKMKIKKEVKKDLKKDSKNEVKCFRDNSKMDELEFKIVEGLSDALKTIPSLLCTNSGGNALKMIPLLESKHEENNFYGIDGLTGQVVDIRKIVREPLVVKSQCIKSAIETVCMLLRVDGIIQSNGQ